MFIASPVVDRYEIGQVFPLDRAAGLFDSDEDSPAWFALLSQPMKETAARSWLERHGVEAWFPTVEVWRRKRGAGRQRERVTKPLAPGYVFAQFPGSPFWDRLLDAWPGRLYLRGVVGVNAQPLKIRNSDMLAMSQLPDRLAQLRAAEEERRRVRPGDRVRVTGGPLEGWVVSVQSISGSMAELLLPLLGGSVGRADLKVLERLQ